MNADRIIVLEMNMEISSHPCNLFSRSKSAAAPDS